MSRPSVGLIALALVLACSPGEPTHGAAGGSGTGGGAGDGGSDQGQAGSGDRVCGESPHGCPSDAPTYHEVVGPLVAQRCLPCHAEGGVEASRPLDSYPSLFARRGSVLTQLVSCAMPPTTSTPLSADERAAVLTWLVCGAPDD